MVHHQKERLIAGFLKKLLDPFGDPADLARIDSVVLAKIELKAFLGRDVELADDPRTVASRLELVWNRSVAQFRMQGETAVGQAILPRGMGMQPCEHRAAGWTAGGLRDIGGSKLHAAAGELVYVRCLDQGFAVATELQAEVVGGDEEDVKAFSVASLARRGDRRQR